MKKRSLGIYTFVGAFMATLVLVSFFDRAEIAEPSAPVIQESEKPVIVCGPSFDIELEDGSHITSAALYRGGELIILSKEEYLELMSSND